ncbi:hypothetical protein CONPUDRAFT_77073 [Coniophora puteana RWD-64-598 SS2]|uniref:C2H2-type domain-containing protein n=1 Tax=Coniophora puteana (strain RWD-64-598) TaxID=741705 RepID=A0A5M3MBQ2_CONPW|nr:uncharacterized protein CONPUDRAFT_77073 [Coniophora puteana RWD-64-598 SS2]EIW76061.1 hypothetical protein CONPUDRAFT_77073 [Coniophora puteana RWD-64-598 SS2]
MSVSLRLGDQKCSVTDSPAQSPANSFLDTADRHNKAATFGRNGGYLEVGDLSYTGESRSQEGVHSAMTRGMSSSENEGKQACGGFRTAPWLPPSYAARGYGSVLDIILRSSRLRGVSADGSTRLCTACPEIDLTSFTPESIIEKGAGQMTAPNKLWEDRVHEAFLAWQAPIFEYMIIARSGLPVGVEIKFAWTEKAYLSQCAIDEISERASRFFGALVIYMELRRVESHPPKRASYSLREAYPSYLVNAMIETSMGTLSRSCAKISDSNFRTPHLWEISGRKPSLLLEVEDTSGSSRRPATEVATWGSDREEGEGIIDLGGVKEQSRHILYDSQLNWQRKAPGVSPTSTSRQSTPDLHPDYSPLSETTSAPYTPQASSFEGPLDEAHEPAVAEHTCNDDLVASIRESGVINPIQLLSPQKLPVFEDQITIDVDISPLLNPGPLVFSPPITLSLFPVPQSLIGSRSTFEAELCNKALRCKDGSSVMWQDNPIDEGCWSELCSFDQSDIYSLGSYLDAPLEEGAQSTADTATETPSPSQLPTESLAETTALHLRSLSPLTSCDSSPLSSPRLVRPLPKRAAYEAALETQHGSESGDKFMEKVDEDSDAESGYSGDGSVGSGDDEDYIPSKELGRKRKVRTEVVATQRKRARREGGPMHAARARSAASRRSQPKRVVGNDVPISPIHTADQSPIGGSLVPSQKTSTSNRAQAEENQSGESDDDDDDDDHERPPKVGRSKVSRSTKRRIRPSGGRDQRSGKCVPCRYCDKTFSRGHDAKRHENNTCVHSPSYKQAEVGECPLCGRADLSRKDSMQRHISKCKGGVGDN